MKRSLAILFNLVCISALSGIVLTPATTNTNPAAVAAWIGATNNGDFKSDGSVPMTGPLNLGGKVATNGATPTRSDMLGTKGYIDTAITGATNTIFGWLGTAAFSNASVFASAASLTTVSNGLNVVSNGLSATSNKLNSVSNSLTATSNNVNTVSNALTSATNALDAGALNRGTVPPARLPAFTGGDVTSSSGSTTLTLGPSGVTAGSYTSSDITVGSDGRITSISNGSGGSGLTGVTTGEVTWGDQQHYAETVDGYHFGGATGVDSDNNPLGSNITAKAVYTTKVTFPDGMSIIDEGISAAVHIVSPLQGEQLIVGVQNFTEVGDVTSGNNVFVIGDHLQHTDPTSATSGAHINFMIVDDTAYVHTIQFDDTTTQTTAAKFSVGTSGKVNTGDGSGGWIDTPLSVVVDAGNPSLLGGDGGIAFDDGGSGTMVVGTGLDGTGAAISFKNGGGLGVTGAGILIKGGESGGTEISGGFFVNGAASFGTGADMNDSPITSVADPSTSSDAMTLNYANTHYGALSTTVRTNFISGTTYTSPYDVPILVSCNVALSAAAVSGDVGVELRIPSITTNTSSIQTLLTSIAMKYTNVISGIVPAGGTYVFTNVSSGAGNSASLIGGQILIP